MKYTLLNIFFFLFLITTTIYIKAQEQALSNLRTQIISNITTDSLHIDSLSIVPQSLEIKCFSTQEKLDTNAYQIIEAEALIIFKNKKVLCDSLLLNYRVFPYNFSAVKTHKQKSKILDFGSQAYTYRYDIDKNRNKNALFDAGNLAYSGSFGRGISFGNNQDLVLNSNFNLQMSGKLANDLEIVAAITDSNIPFQPEGNTQQIQEFDRIFVQLKRKKNSLLLGDYDLKKIDNHFLKISRRLQGVQLKTQNDFGEKHFIKTTASGAIAKGNYNRMNIVGEEGNQGPYKLFGSNNESFIIVLSGSERVYIDGVLLLRGADNDYVINYNTGELTFTPNALITKDKRIIIEFEYSDQNYLRSLFQVGGTYQYKKLHLDTYFFTEQDAKNQLLVEGTTPENYISAMRNIGDDIENALVSSGDSIAFTTERILYKKIDTLVNDVLYEDVFVQSNNAENAFYTASFSYVGEKKGHYKISEGSLNGRVYEWFASDSLGQLQGSYEAVIKLITPKKRQQLVLSSRYDISENQQLTSEISISNQDVNTFSDIDDKDDVGIAVKIAHNNKVSIAKTAKKKRILETNLNYEFRQNRFQSIEPYRAVEFGRNWNLATNQQRNENEHLAQGSLQFYSEKGWKMRYQMSAFVLENKAFQGLQQLAELKFKNKFWNMRLYATYLSSQNDSLENTRFLRPKMEISRSFGKEKRKFKIGVFAEQEKNKILPSLDSLSNRSFYYNQIETYVTKNASESDNTFKIAYIRRWDYGILNNGFALANVGNTITADGSFVQSSKQQLTYKMTFRNLQIVDSTLTNEKQQQNLLGNANYTFVLGKGFLRSSTQYQLASGQTQSTEYQYIKVAEGTGNYVWRDGSNGSAADNIEQLEEFEIANENTQVTANYIRIVSPTNAYQATKIVQINESLQFSPKALWHDSDGFKKFMSRFSMQNSISIRRENIAENNNLLNYLPFNTLDDSLIVSQNSQIRSTLFFNRNHQKFEMNAFVSQIVNKNFLVNGTDKRSKNEQGGTIRYNLNSKFSLNMKGENGVLSSDSEAFDNRNYAIHYWSVEPNINFLPNKNLKTSLSFKYKIGEDRLPQLEDRKPAKINRLNAEMRYGKANKSNLTAKFSYVIIQFEGDNSTSVAYNLLDGLQTGNNFLWNMAYNTRLSNNIQLSLSYDGRKSAESRINHVGRASVRAVF